MRPDGPQAFGSYEGINARVTFPLWELIAGHQEAFSAMFAWGDTQFAVGQGVDARQARGLWVSGDFFQVLGIAPERGRLLGPDDDRRGCGGQAAVVSHAFWQTHFGGRDSAVGSTVTLRRSAVHGRWRHAAVIHRSGDRGDVRRRAAQLRRRACGTPASSSGIAGG